MVHLLPHWTHPEKEGVRIQVVAYGNCGRVELFFNNRSLREQTMEEDLQLLWQVPYFAIHVIADKADKHTIRANAKYRVKAREKTSEKK
jgi:beta-galactosidase